jgi:RNA polymerase sigma-70 factor, ECF subfamily
MASPTDPTCPSGAAVPATGSGALRDDRADQRATDLMGAVKRGDRLAFDDLVRQIRTRAFHVAAGLVGSRDDALELCQEAFLKVYRARETYRESEPFMPWFHRILRNTCFSFLRSSKRLRTTSIDVDESDERRGGWDIEADVPHVSSGLEAEELSDRFRQAFERLSARDREIVTLRHFDELSYREIARVLEIPEGTVMSRLFHARRRLRDALGTGFADLVPPEASAPKSAGRSPRTERAK